MTAQRNMLLRMLSTAVICCLLRSLKSGLHQDRLWSSENPTGKSHMSLVPVKTDMEYAACNVWSTTLVVTFKDVYVPAEEVLLLNKVLLCTEIPPLQPFRIVCFLH
ncbi:hypothetical protein AVEN_27241-1 [Araneus ventricosus]|uniref:Uncharacterized protein n=1 Tax=Araneus ventricosus TaxID=182803 RepID=A0A4Y2C9N9_ARAVE|nr:hypothetical protein AVEN_27241-1 [Araneus ventricosus]